MKKIGNTLAGSVIVEMTADEYQALKKLQGNSDNHSSAIDRDGKASDSMTRDDLANYVADRLRSFKPKKMDGVIRSIEAMFQFTEGSRPKSRQS